MSEKTLMLLDRAGNRIGPLENAVFESAKWELCKEGELRFSINPLAPLANRIVQWATEIQLWIDDELKWWGIPMAANGGPAKLSWQCEGLLSWFKKRFIDVTTLVYGDATTDPISTVDQFDIIWDLVRYAQQETGWPGGVTQPNRNLRILAGDFDASHINRIAIYDRQEHKSIYDCLQEFTTMFQGVEFEIQIFGDGGRFFMPYYPKKGGPKPNYAMIYKPGDVRNIANFSVTSNGQDMANDEFSTGGSVEGQKIEERYHDDAKAVTYGVLQTIHSQGSQLDRTWLHDHAQQDIDQRKDPIVTYSVTAARTENIDMFGNVEVGDWIPVNIDYGAIQANETRRVNAITLNADDSLSVEFGDVVPA